MAGDFKDLIAWQKSMDLAMCIYEISSTFPQHEQFGLTNQIRRAAVSIASNIAEGHGRKSDQELLRFLKIANGSRQEVETQLILAERFGYVGKIKLENAYCLLDEVGRIIFGLIRSKSKG